MIFQLKQSVSSDRRRFSVQKKTHALPALSHDAFAILVSCLHLSDTSSTFTTTLYPRSLGPLHSLCVRMERWLLPRSQGMATPLYPYRKPSSVIHCTAVCSIFRSLRIAYRGTVNCAPCKYTSLRVERHCVPYHT